LKNEVEGVDVEVSNSAPGPMWIVTNKFISRFLGTPWSNSSNPKVIRLNKEKPEPKRRPEAQDVELSRVRGYSQAVELGRWRGPLHYLI
jgi:hypothetical protein